MREINEAWKKTCKILLGGEIGELARFEGHLSRFVTPLSSKKSAISGIGVAVHEGSFCKGAQFISNSESEKAGPVSASRPLDINSIKDMDSILDALGGRVYYSGNIVLGNSSNVRLTNRCVNSSYIYASSNVYDSEYVAYSSIMRYMKYAFGADTVADSAFVIGGFNTTHDTRCFEVNQTFYSSDCYYVANLEGCNECMFSFNLRNASYCIGNLALPKPAYEKIKAKLLEDIRATLASKKEAPRIIDFLAVRKGKPEIPAPNGGISFSKAHALQPGKGASSNFQSSQEQIPRAAALEKINSAWGETAMLVFGKKLGQLSDYGAWLQGHVPPPRKSKSVASGTGMVIPNWHFFKPVKDFVAFEESLELGRQSLSKTEVETLTLAKATETLKRLSLTSPWFYRKSIGMVDVAISREAQYCYWGSIYVFSRYCAYCHWPRDSQYVFGSNLVFSSKFCIKCHDSNGLTRCFEVSDSNNCSDCYFCHNCEGMQDCMFCFNTKNKKYAIFNVELGKGKYLELKKSVLARITGELGKNKSLGIDIFNLGCLPAKMKQERSIKQR
ncbi:MAG TPA: hypothetical protein PLO51_02130 [Candidatus Micrarchaeota archaeon]|nr:hypothetical protein [Candidatus Micrarchaeota archaeon]